MIRRGPPGRSSPSSSRPFVVGLFAAACDSSTTTPNPDDPNTLSVLAGSEVKDLRAALADLQKATGVSLAMKYSGTLEGAESIAGGVRTDVAWFSSGHYLSLLPGAGSRIVAQREDHAQPGRPRREAERRRPIRLVEQLERHLEGHPSRSRRTARSSSR
ncbi:MAG: hypothetical protein WKF78_11960 [Candidatus Limnocylindrales bacterium]